MSDPSFTLLTPAGLAAVMLLSVRIAPVLVMTPVLSALQVPPSVRVLLVLGLANVMVMGVPGAVLVELAGVEALIVAALRELVLGAALAFGVLCAFAAFSFAGRLLDLQAGFGVSQLFDPATRSQMPVLANAFSQLAVLMFFLLDAHHALMRGLWLSVQYVPPGSPWELSDSASVIVSQACVLFALGVALVAPVVFWLLLVELGLAVSARALPQMNVLLLGMPVRIACALLGLSLWMRSAQGPMERVYRSLFEGWSAWLR